MVFPMKIWMKYLLGAILGLVVALVLPVEDAGLRGTLSFLFELSMRIGRYALVPLVIFTVPVAVFELNEDKEFWRNLGRSVVTLLVAVVALTIVGVVVASIANPARIPLLADTSAPSSAPGIKDLLFAIFPDTPFAALASGQFLLPVFLLAVLIGLAFSHDRPATKPVLLIFDAMSRIFYQINTFFAEFLGILIIAVTAHSVLELRATVRPELYRPLLLAVLFEVIFAAFVLMPLPCVSSAAGKIPTGLCTLSSRRRSPPWSRAMSTSPWAHSPSTPRRASASDGGATPSIFPSP